METRPSQGADEGSAVAVGPDQPSRPCQRPWVWFDGFGTFLITYYRTTEVDVERKNKPRPATRPAPGDGNEGPLPAPDGGASVEMPVETGHPRVITIVGTIAAETVERVADQLALLNAESSDPIVVQISSGGGSIIAGWAIHDMFLTSAAPIITAGFGYVGSAATVIFQAGLARLLSPNTRLMIHEISRSLTEGTDFDKAGLREELREMSRLQRDIERMFAKRTGQPIDRIRDWCEDETAFSAREAVKHGFADKVLHGRRFPVPRKRR